MKFFQRENAAGERPLIVRSGALFLALCLVMTLLGGTFGTVAEAAWSANTGTATAKTIYLNDVGADGATVETLPVQFTGDESVAQALADVQLGADGRAASDCVWYTLSAEGEKHLLALDAQPDDGAQLFTYTYQLTVLVEPKATEEPQPEETAQPTEAPETVGDLPAASPAESTPAPEAADAPQANAAVQAADAGAPVAEAAQPEATAAPTEAPTAEPAASTAAPSPEPTAQPADPTAAPAADAARAADEGTPGEETPAQEPLTITVTAREGTALDAASFEQDGVDYTTYDWTNAETGEAVDSAALLAAGLSADVAVYASTDNTSAKVHVMVSDGSAWKEVAILTGMCAKTGTSLGRSYVYAKEILKVLQPFGVTEILSGKYIFAISDDQKSVWGNAPTATLNGEIVVQLNEHTGETWVYYAPKNLLGDGKIDEEEPTSEWITPGGKNFAMLVINDGYAHATFNEENKAKYHTFTEASKVATPDAIPAPPTTYYMVQATGADDFEPFYAQKGDQVTVTLPAPGSGESWRAEGLELPAGTQGPDGKITYTFTMPASVVNFEKLQDGKVAVKSANGIVFKVLVDNVWQTVGDKLSYADGLIKVGNNERLYLTAETLAQYYGAYGFKAEDLSKAENKYLFGHATIGNPDVWYDQAAQEYSGVCVLPIMTKAHNDAKRSLQVYYLPGHSTSVPSGTHYENINDQVTNDALGFYTVSLDNTKSGLADSSQTSAYPKIFRAGESHDCTLPALKSGFEWLIVNPNTGAALPNDTVTKKSDNADGTITYTINNISQPIMFYAAPTNVSITFWAAVNGEWQQVEVHTKADGVLLTGSYKGRYYVTAKTLESIYGKFGFKATTLDDTADASKVNANNSHIFPHRSDNDRVSIWGDVPVQALADGTKVALVTTSANGNHLYYVPNNVEKNADGSANVHFSGYPYPAISSSQPTKADGTPRPNEWHELPYTDATGSEDSKEAARTILAENNFYGVIVEDPESKLADINAASLSSYAQDANATHTITLPVGKKLPTGYTWWITYNDKTIALESLGDAGNKEIAEHIKVNSKVDENGSQPYTVTLPVDEKGNVGNIKFTLAQSSGAKLEDMNVRTVYWVSIDGAWKRIADEKTVDGQFTAGPYAGRYFVTAGHLAKIYEAYHFTTDMLKDPKNACMFPYRTSRQELTVWADNPVQQIEVDGKQIWVIPLRSETDKTGDNHVYYMPGNTITDAENKPYGCLTGTGTGVDAPSKTAISVGTDSKTNHAEDNAFYSVSVDNTVNGIKEGFAVPEKLILRAGDPNGTYTVPPLINEDQKRGFKWIISDLKGKIIQTNDGSVFDNPETGKDGRTTYTIKSKNGAGIQHPIVFRVEYVDGDTFAYNAGTMDQDMLVKVGSLYPVNQKIKENGTITIDGKPAAVQKVKLEGFETAPDDTKYTARAPDQDALRVEAQGGDANKQDEHPRTIFYHFAGWRIGWGNKILQAGASITKEELTKMQGHESQILRALWTPLDKANDIDTANFYLSLNCEVRDYHGSGSNGTENKNNFTESLYAARVLKEPEAGHSNLWNVSKLDNSNGARMFLSVPASDKTGYSADTALRTSPRIAIAGNKPQYKVKLSAFPSDEEIFAKLRAMNSEEYASKHISIDGHPVPQDHLTTENFQIRWYTLKYQTSDGWHIDGVLVAKESRLVVTKTFSGDAAAIQKVKDQGFSITVSHDGSNADNADNANDANDALNLVKDFDLVLREKRTDDGDVNGEMGYTSYNAATNTYTWVLTGRQSDTYYLTENNYTIQKSSEDDRAMQSTKGGATEYRNIAEYRITNLPGYNTNGYVPYETSTTGKNEVKVEPVSSDLPAAAQPTIAFRNTYMKAGMLTLKKVDSETDSGLANVQFVLTRGTVKGGQFTADKAQPTLYRKKLTNSTGRLVDTYEYSNIYKTPEDAEKDSYTKVVANNTIITSPNGQVYLNLDPTDTGSDKTVYQLREVVPEGYTGQQFYYVTIDAEGKLVNAAYTPDAVVGAEGDADRVPIGGGSNAAPDDKATDGAASGGSTTVEWIKADPVNGIITIKNSSRLLTEVIARKQWATSEYTEPVTVQLLRNGAPVPDVTDADGKVTTSYTKVLDKTNSWTFTWKNLPLYIDGELARYSLREVKIGSDALPDATGNYADYVVTYDATKYARYDDETMTVENANWGTNASWKDTDGKTVYADHALLVVHNRKTNGDIMFAKVDGSGNTLNGAKFALYKDEACNTPVTTTNADGAETTTNVVATSKNGVVQFEKMPDGTYYMKETTPPPNYSSDGSVYKVVVDKGTVSITRVGGDAGTEINQIVNARPVELHLTKLAADEAGNYNEATPTPLKGAVFTLYQVENNTERIYRENLTTGQDGKLEIKDLLSGSYVLRETAAPAGYRLVEDFAFTVGIDGQISLAVGDGELPDGWVAFGQHADVSDGDGIDGEGGTNNGSTCAYDVVAVDKATWYFPTTGGVGIYVPTLAGTCLLCAAAWLVWRRAAARPSL